ncbi:hypothetical protein PG988_011439 [Apiospora saccharicola]
MTSRVGQLHVRAEDGKGDYETLPSTSTRFRIVEALIHLGLSVLETQQGKHSLVEVGKAVIKGIDERRKRNRRVPGHIYKGDLNDLPYWVDRFLSTIRNDFPVVCIDPDCEGEASAQRYDWEPTGEDMNKYSGEQAGLISVNKDIIENMLYARQQGPSVAGGSYDTFKFQMGLTVAHEIIHLFVGFLTGSERAMTPPNVSMPGYDRNETTGEAGRYWERIFLGGMVENWSTKDHPMRDRQSGTPYLFDDAHTTSSGRPVSATYMKEFINGGTSSRLKAIPVAPIHNLLLTSSDSSILLPDPRIQPSPACDASAAPSRRRDIETAREETDGQGARRKLATGRRKPRDRVSATTAQYPPSLRGIFLGIDVVLIPPVHQILQALAPPRVIWMTYSKSVLIHI